MKTRKQVERAELALIAFGLVILAGYTGWNLYLDHARMEERERMRLADQARIINDNLGWQLGAMNHALTLLQQDLPGLLRLRGGFRRLDQRLESLNGTMPGVRTVFVQDRAGTVIACDRAELIGRNFQDRAYFQLARRVNDPSVLHVSSPIRNALGTFAINLERSLADPKGGFAGLVAVTLDPAYFTTLLSSVNYATDVRTSLAHADGTLFLTVPLQVIPAGNSLAQPGSLFSRHMASGQTTTVLTGRISGGAGEWRLMAQSTVRPGGIPMDAPLVVSVSRDRNALFTTWRHDLWDKARLLGLLALSSISGLLALQNRKRGLAAAQKRAEEALRESELRFRGMFESHGAVMLLVDPGDGRIEDANPAAARFYGYSRERLRSLNMADLNTGPGSLTQHRMASGELRAVEVHASPTVILGATLLFSIVMDITERERFDRERALHQRELETLNQSLEVRVQEAVNQLRDRDRLLIAQNRQAALGEMIGNIAHQWRQPLNTLSMILINLEEACRFHELDPERLDQSLAKGHELIQKMSTTINDFRYFFRPEKANAAFSALEQVRSTVALVDIAFEALGIAILIEAREDVVLFGLPNEFSQVLLNLLSNAKQAICDAGRGDGRIVLAIQAQDGCGCLRVADNGGGIPEPFLDRIFEPYFSTREGGTGIGLYMSKQIIEQSMKGRLLARNAGPGAEFTVLVPLAEAGG